MQIAVDFGLDKGKFSNSIDDMLNLCVRNKLAVTIPIELGMGNNAITVISTFLSMYNCSDCDGMCCKSGHDNLIIIETVDYKRLLKYDGARNVIFQDNRMIMRYPCQYLKDGKCSIYNIRPAVCVSYPVQPATGGYVGLETACPKTLVIAKRIYMNIWEILHLR